MKKMKLIIDRTFNAPIDTVRYNAARWMVGARASALPAAPKDTTSA